MHIYQPQQSQVCTLPPQPRGASVSPVAGPGATTDDRLSRLAAEAVKRQRYTQALQLMGQLIERHPQRAMYYSNRGLVYLYLDQPRAALADCDRAVDLGPNLDQAYNNRALCHAALGHITAALDDYERAVDINPFNSCARINLGATLRQLGDLDGALDCFDEALMFYQLPEFIYAERGRTYHLRGDWNCALADYRRSLAAAAAQPPSPQIQALIHRVNGYIHELMPQPSCA
ncbi:MAG: tetratricopeptide repeat protein [Leptolyngbya sp. DLM2.Bin27]|nr:MAG: tetratricopeptide repeat protein [Leptolyngbya sp. DLM2.Bin27]